jgi:hypothetical protein
MVIFQAHYEVAYIHTRTLGMLSLRVHIINNDTSPTHNYVQHHSFKTIGEHQKNKLHNTHIPYCEPH